MHSPSLFSVLMIRFSNATLNKYQATVEIEMSPVVMIVNATGRIKLSQKSFRKHAYITWTSVWRCKIIKITDTKIIMTEEKILNIQIVIPLQFYNTYWDKTDNDTPQVLQQNMLVLIHFLLCMIFFLFAFSCQELITILVNNSWMSKTCMLGHELVKLYKKMHSVNNSTNGCSAIFNLKSII